jgi:hypothetical protein
VCGAGDACSQCEGRQTVSGGEGADFLNPITLTLTLTLTLTVTLSLTLSLSLTLTLTL